MDDITMRGAGLSIPTVIKPELTSVGDVLVLQVWTRELLFENGSIPNGSIPF